MFLKCRQACRYPFSCPSTACTVFALESGSEGSSISKQTRTDKLQKDFYLASVGKSIYSLNLFKKRHAICHFVSQFPTEIYDLSGLSGDLER